MRPAIVPLAILLILPAGLRAQAAESAAALPDTATAYEVEDVEQPPELINRSRISRSIVRNYPPEMRDAGREGTVVIRMRVSEEGRSAVTRVAHSSGSPEFDRAAVRIAQEMRFRPAKIGGHPVPAWITIPVNFDLQP